ncbi:MAG: hypothetical protein K8E24_012455 [Methanobacterium paludis]|nr:hypothetical protein [Methanobacterium paludis]
MDIKKVSILFLIFLLVGVIYTTPGVCIKKDSNIKMEPTFINTTTVQHNTTQIKHPQYKHPGKKVTKKVTKKITQNVDLNMAYTDGASYGYYALSNNISLDSNKYYNSTNKEYIKSFNQGFKDSVEGGL